MKVPWNWRRKRVETCGDDPGRDNCMIERSDKAPQGLRERGARSFRDDAGQAPFKHRLNAGYERAFGFCCIMGSTPLV